MQIEGKIVMITGGAMGLGEAMSRRFAAEGAVVYIADMNGETAEATAASIRETGGKTESLILNVTEETDWTAAVKKITADCGRIDVLINNAGITKRQPLTELPLEDYEQIMAVNARGPFLGCKHVLPVMQQHKSGSIVNISSICGLIGHKFSGESYIMSKGAVTLLTKAVAVKYAKYGIRCNSVHPSTAETAIMKDLFKDPAKRQERIDEIPMGRMARPEEIAAAALFLASDEASFINGVALPVDGGLTAS